MPISRDIAAEQRALKTYQGIYKKNPTSSTDWDALHSLAYPTGLPDEFKKAADASMGSAGLNNPTAAPLPQTTATSNLPALQQGVTAAGTKLEGLSQPNEALRVLQDAIRTKSGVMEQPLGTSPVFEAAGLTGMGALNASIASQTEKYKNDYADSVNYVKAMSGTYKDMADTALQSYNNAYTAFKDETDRLQKIQDDLNDHKNAIDLANQQYKNNIALEAYKNAHPGIGDIKDAEAAGMENVGGAWLPKDRNVVTSPSGHAYDWSTYNAVGTPEEQTAYIRSVQSAISNVGKIKNDEELQKYIDTNMAGSKITVQDIKNAAGKIGVGYEEILGLVKKEANGGASNVAIQNNNFGGITWSPSYQANHPNVKKGTPRPAAEGGNYVKFPSVQAGLEAVADQFKGREVRSETAVGGNVSDKAQDFALKNVKVIFGGNPSEGERAAVIDFYKRRVAQGITDDNAILNEFIDYKINKESEEFGTNLRNVVSQNLETGKTFKEFGSRDLANLINSDKKAEAIRKVESFVYEKAKKQEGDNYISEASVRATVSKANELNALLQELDKDGKNPIGNFQGTITDWLGRFKGKEAAQVKAKITTLVANMRKDLSGSAVTPSEMQFLVPIIPILGDSAENFAVKTAELKDSPLKQLNAIRESYGLPPIDEKSLQNFDEKVSLYDGGTETKTETPQDGLTDEQAYDEYLKITNKK